MTITFDIEYRDFEAFRLYHAANEKSLRRMRIVMLFLVPILIVVPLLLKGSNGWGLPAILLSGFWVALFNYLFRWSLKFSTKKIYDNPGNARLWASRSMTFDSEGIAVKSQNADPKFLWNDIVKVGETSEHFFVFTGSYQAYIVPKRELTDNQTAELKGLFDTNNKLQKKNKELKIWQTFI